MNAIRGRVTESGRVSLPSEFRRAIGLKDGGEVVFELEGGGIRITTVDEIVARAQRLTRELLGSAVDTELDAFLADRRAEARSE